MGFYPPVREIIQFSYLILDNPTAATSKICILILRWMKKYLLVLRIDLKTQTHRLPPQNFLRK